MTHEKVLLLNGQLGARDKGYFYFIDTDGDISRTKRNKPWSIINQRAADAHNAALKPVVNTEPVSEVPNNG